MKTRILLLIVSALLTLSGTSISSTWDIDPAHSVANFKVKHMMISDVLGNFRDIKGTLQLDENNVEQSKVDVTIGAASIDTGVDKRDAHLKSADFFDVEKYPTLRFKSKQVKKTGNETLTMTGDLTIHGITKEVVLAVSGPTAEIKDPWGNLRRAAKATTEINRKDFGLTWNAALEAGGVLVGDEIKIEIDAQFIKRTD